MSILVDSLQTLPDEGAAQAEDQHELYHDEYHWSRFWGDFAFQVHIFCPCSWHFWNTRLVWYGRLGYGIAENSELYNVLKKALFTTMNEQKYMYLIFMWHDEILKSSWPIQIALHPRFSILNLLNGPPGFKSLNSREPKLGLTSN